MVVWYKTPVAGSLLAFEDSTALGTSLLVGIDFASLYARTSSMPGDYPFEKAQKANLRGNLPGNLPFFWYEGADLHLELTDVIQDKYSYCF